ncbi:MAG TPA: type IV-A pilus assembly ATPase PilB [Acidobacteriota bacterium]|nr:type IV-A pilus assembly ATPase PilB [Acidobacteriota bacterium]
MSTQIGDLLVKKNLITTEQLREAEKKSHENGETVTYNIISLGYVDEHRYVSMLSKHYGIPSVDLDNVEIDISVLSLLQPEFCVKNSLIPIRRNGAVLVIAIADPANLFAIDTIRFMTSYNVETMIAGEMTIREAIERYYGEPARKDHLSSVLESLEIPDETISVAEEEDELDVADLERSGQDAPVVKLVNVILHEAVQRGASDIHIEPYEKSYRVRYRIDGILYEIMRPPKRLKDSVASRIKILSQLDISEKRLPQDGRILLKMRTPTGIKDLDLRVSVLPTLYGEKIVMRILDKENLMLDLTRLGMEQHSLDILARDIQKPYGMILVTGPTGSGKTNTLYSALSMLNNDDVNILTAEDPVEFNLAGINQVQVKEKIGLTFASSLRSFLRQDPNIIMVGEIRDFETAEIAIKAALTGHLVLSTLHTNDAPGTISRLMNMGIEPFLVATSVLSILAQRLVRRICPDCKEVMEMPPKALVDIGFTEEESKTVKVYKGRGVDCKTCGGTGYKGRIGLFELMEVNQSIRDLVLSGGTSDDLRRQAKADGMITLRRSGLEKIKAGVSTLEEVLRETMK